MTIFLTAATLALAPMMSSAGKNARTPELLIDEAAMTCNCSDPGDPEPVLNEDGSPVLLEGGTEAIGAPVTCTASWPNAIGISPDHDFESATYGASFDVELQDDATEEEQAEALKAELEVEDWSIPCNGENSENGTRCVLETTFHLTNFDSEGQNVEVYAAVKAFSTGKVKNQPRNFMKSRKMCEPYDTSPTVSDQ